MRIFLMADNWLGWKVAQHLNSLNENIVGLALHPEGYQNYANEIIEELNISIDKVLIGKKQLEPTFIEKVRQLRPDIILVVYWNYILPEKLFSIPKSGCVNFHMAYLPYNRGKNPNVWSIIEGTPAGVTMHYIDSGIDTGKIISQKKVNVEIIDTAKSIFNKQLKAFVELFIETWPKIKDSSIQPIPQDLNEGTFHYSNDFQKLSEISLEDKIYPLDLINQLRAKMFEPHPPAYFILNGKKVYVSISLKYES
jgi:methionyl-tRNA formyltransferase